MYWIFNSTSDVKQEGAHNDRMFRRSPIQPVMHSGTKKEDVLIGNCFAVNCFMGDIEDLYIILLSKILFPFLNNQIKIQLESSYYTFLTGCTYSIISEDKIFIQYLRCKDYAKQAWFDVLTFRLLNVEAAPENNQVLTFQTVASGQGAGFYYDAQSLS